MKINKSNKLNYYLAAITINVGSLLFVFISFLAAIERGQIHYRLEGIVSLFLLLILDFILFKIRIKLLCDVILVDDIIKIMYFKKNITNLSFSDVKTIVFIKDTIYLSSEIIIELNTKKINDILKSKMTISFKVLYDKVKMIVEKTDVNEIFFVENAVSNVDKAVYEQVYLLGRKNVIV